MFKATLSDPELSDLPGQAKRTGLICVDYHKIPKLGKRSIEEIAIVTAVTVDYVLELQRAIQSQNTKH